MAGMVSPPMPRPSAGGGLDGTHGTHSDEDVANGGEGEALASLLVVGDLVGGSHGVRLEGEVVVGDLLALALEEVEHVIGGTLGLLDELDLEVTLGVLEVLGDALLDIHGLGLLADEGTIGIVGLLDVVDDTGELGDASLGGLSVGGDSVGEHHNLGVELGLRGGEGSTGRGGGSGGGSVEGGGGGLLLLALGGELLGELLRGLGEVLLHLNGVVGVLLAEVLDASVELGGESLHLLVGGALVLVHDGAEGTTGTGIIGVVLVGEVLDALEVLVDLLVDASLELLLGLDLSGNLVDVVHEGGLGVLHEGSHSDHLHGEVLAELLHGSSGLGLGGVDVLDRLAEARVGEGSLLGEGLVEAIEGGTEVELGLTTVLGHASDGSTELLLGLLLGDFHLGLEELEGGLLLLGVLGGELRHGLGGAGLLGLDLTLGLGSEGIDVGAGLLGLLDHAVGVGVETGVGLL